MLTVLGAPGHREPGLHPQVCLQLKGLATGPQFPSYAEKSEHCFSNSILVNRNLLPKGV